MAKTNYPAASSLIKELQLRASEAGKGFVFHDADDTVARPTGYASVEWVGEVDPINAINGDTWVDTSI